MMIRITSIVTLMLISGLAYAQEKTTVTSLQGMLGFNAEVDVDKIKSAQGSANGDDDDLESNFGGTAGGIFCSSTCAKCPAAAA